MRKPVGEPTGNRPVTPRPSPTVEKKTWEEPKLNFVEPKLTKHGKLEKITREQKDGFFGQFSP